MITTYVTQPSMPPLAEFIPYLEKIWENKWLTNAGPFHAQLEATLTDYLGVGHVSLMANGTSALIIALQALQIQDHEGKGSAQVANEVITTPFSFVATSNAIVWNGMKPVFADVDPVTCNLDPDAVEAAITPRTAAILPVHCFGHPCDTGRLQAIADRHNLPIIYDAAHAFGVRQGGTSVLGHGTMSTLSFHATKVFNTFEGGAIICQDRAMGERLSSLRNFGFVDDSHIGAIGMNGKMSEVQAAFGLLQLKHLPAAIDRRRHISDHYHRMLANIEGITLFPTAPDVEPNHAYFPILVDTPYPMTRDTLHAMLQARGISARRYFYPLISDMPAYRHTNHAQTDLPHAKRIAASVLCLPIFPDLDDERLDTIIATIRAAIPERQAA